MGGRGKWSEVTNTGFTWYDYHKTFQFRNTHYLVQHAHVAAGISAPVKSQTPNVTYVTLDKNMKPKYISVYRNRLMQYQIDLTKEHYGIIPHVHHCKKDGYRYTNENPANMKLTKKQQNKVRVILATVARHTEVFHE